MAQYWKHYLAKSGHTDWNIIFCFSALREGGGRRYKAEMGKGTEPLSWWLSMLSKLHSCPAGIRTPAQRAFKPVWPDLAKFNPSGEI